MKKNLIIMCIIAVFVSIPRCYPYWEWTPQTHRWINPKYTPKETAKQQLEWAENMRAAGKMDVAIREYKKVVKFFPLSTEAPKALYALSEIYENQGEKEVAFDFLQQIVDKYPNYPDIQKVLEREHLIARSLIAEKRLRFPAKFLQDPQKKQKRVEGLIESDPYGQDTAELTITLANSYARNKKFEKSEQLLNKVIQDFPNTEWEETARYELLKKEIASIPEVCTDTAQFAEVERKIDRFIADFPNTLHKQDLENEKIRLRNVIAGRLFNVAQLYEKSGKHASAEIYYRKIRSLYPETDYAKRITVSSP